jgi:hypothetical protein
MIVLVVQEQLSIGVDGLFVEDGNQDEFIKQLQLLMSNETLRLEMGKKRSYKYVYQIEVWNGKINQVLNVKTRL